MLDVTRPFRFIFDPDRFFRHFPQDLNQFFQGRGHSRPQVEGHAVAPVQGTDVGIGDIPHIDKVPGLLDRKSTRLNSSHVKISYAVFCLKKKIKTTSKYEATKVHIISVY